MVSPSKAADGPAMDITDVDRLAASLEGVRRSTSDGLAEWRYRGRLVARELGGGDVVIRCSFDLRDSLLRAFPGTFSAPGRFAKHMMIVADLDSGDREAIEDAIEAAWLLQRRR